MRLLRKACKDHGLLGQGVLMKKIIYVLLLICICLTGCSLQKEYDLCGKDRIEALRAEAAQWESGRYLFTDLSTGEMNQAFSFRYEADGSQTCLYELVIGQRYDIEYYGGGKNYKRNAGNVSVIKEGEEGYVSYSRENPHPYSTGDLLFYVNLYTASSSERTDEDGNTVYTYIYDTEKLNKALGMSFTAFSTEYVFSSDGTFLYFTQTNSDSDGSYSYRIDVIDINAVDVIEDPEAER